MLRAQRTKAQHQIGKKQLRLSKGVGPRRPQIVVLPRSRKGNNSSSNNSFNNADTSLLANN